MKNTRREKRVWLQTKTSSWENWKTCRKIKSKIAAGHGIIKLCTLKGVGKILFAQRLSVC